MRKTYFCENHFPRKKTKAICTNGKMATTYVHPPNLNSNSSTGIVMLDGDDYLPSICTRCFSRKILNSFGICVDCAVMCACKKEGVIFLDGCCFCQDCFKYQFMRPCCQRLTYPNDKTVCKCSSNEIMGPPFIKDHHAFALSEMTLASSNTISVPISEMMDII
jgi:hypothetical protein